MAFWEDLQKGVADAASFTAKKTSELTGIAKLKYTIHSNEQKLDKCFAEIGRLYYEMKKEEADHEIEISTLMMQVDKISADLVLNNAELMKLKKSVPCPECGAEIAKECIFCPVCGLKLDKNEETEEE